MYATPWGMPRCDGSSAHQVETTLCADTQSAQIRVPWQQSVPRLNEIHARPGPPRSGLSGPLAARSWVSFASALGDPLAFNSTSQRCLCQARLLLLPACCTRLALPKGSHMLVSWRAAHALRCRMARILSSLACCTRPCAAKGHAYSVLCVLHTQAPPRSSP